MILKTKIKIRCSENREVLVKFNAFSARDYGRMYGNVLSYYDLHLLAIYRRNVTIILLTVWTYWSARGISFWASIH